MGKSKELLKAESAFREAQIALERVREKERASLSSEREKLVDAMHKSKEVGILQREFEKLLEVFTLKIPIEHQVNAYFYYKSEDHEYSDDDIRVNKFIKSSPEYKERKAKAKEIYKKLMAIMKNIIKETGNTIPKENLEDIANDFLHY